MNHGIYSLFLAVLLMLLCILYKPEDERLKIFIIFILVFVLTYLFLSCCGKRESYASQKLGSCTESTCSENNKLLDPKYNLRECAKQMILLEDHLNNPDKRCEQCIIKHMLSIEALAEEGISLSKTDNPVCSEECISLADKIRKYEDKFSKGEDPTLLAEEIREVRKPLMVKYFVIE